MKNILSIGILVILFSHTRAQSVGLGAASPDSSALLDLNSKTQGFLPPRIYFQQRDNIVNPAAGLIIWCIDCKELLVFDGTIWKNFNGSAATIPDTTIVGICNQVWMGKNLDVSKYRNGDSIPNVTDPVEWSNLTTGAWCWYNNDSATYSATYGKLYNWYAVNDPRGLAPPGWHIPGNDEWTTIVDCLGGDSTAGGAMKEAGTAHWSDPNILATNSSGFTGLPGGIRNNTGVFSDLTAVGCWWSTLAEDATKAWILNLEVTTGALFRYATFIKTGFSVRCIRD
jgi:uncharacterized protein (TIGR02145 family)